MISDSDGNRVSSTINGVTTSYIGNYFEWTGSASTMVNYYYAGSVRVAQRQGTGAAQYFLDDHLGSTSLAVDSNGNLTAELRYKAWGETRYTNGNTPTTYKYTGQKQESALGGTEGLYFYNARWYDPSLGRFIQPDTVLPDPYNPQHWDRYAYCLNNPILLVDPSGHLGSRSDYQIHDSGGSSDDLVYYYIDFTGDWTLNGLLEIDNEVRQTGNALSKLTGESPAEAFNKAFGKVTFNLDSTQDGSGCTAGGHTITCSKGTSDWITTNNGKGLIIHELGHVFDLNYNQNGGASGKLDMSNLVDFRGNSFTQTKGRFSRTFQGYKSDTFPDVMHPGSMGNWNTPTEDFADMFMNWVQDSFDYTDNAYGAGYVRYDWMTQDISKLLN